MPTDSRMLTYNVVSIYAHHTGLFKTILTPKSKKTSVKSHLCLEHRSNIKYCFLMNFFFFHQILLFIQWVFKAHIIGYVCFPEELKWNIKLFFKVLNLNPISPHLVGRPVSGHDFSTWSHSSLLCFPGNERKTKNQAPCSEFHLLPGFLLIWRHWAPVGFSLSQPHPLGHMVLFVYWGLLKPSQLYFLWVFILYLIFRFSFSSGI
jgi:hypothetical protein